MKKIYSFLGAIAITASAVAQAPYAVQKNKGMELVNRPVKPHGATTANKTASMMHAVRLIQSEEMINALGYVSGTDYNVYANAVYMDSTALVSSSTGNSNVFNMRAGANFDPVSIYWGGLSFQPIMTASDAYTVDTVFIGVHYKKVNNAVTDTIYLECQWGPTSSTNWQALSISSQTPALTFVTPKITPSSSNGNTSHLTATTNKLRIKYVLTNADTVDTANDGYIMIPVNQAVPGGNIFSATYEFVPGVATASTDVVWQYSGGSAQTKNGMVGYLYSDPATTSNYKFYDNSSKSIALDYYPKGRYNLYPSAQSFLNTSMLPNTEGGWDMGFSVSYNSTVGINELEKNGFTLSQNVPNPYTGSSLIRYELAKDVKSVKFTVTDVMGRLVAQSNESATTGVHSINLGSYNAGVYYYSLEVDGKATTKKMIVQ